MTEAKFITKSNNSAAEKQKYITNIQPKITNNNKNNIMKNV